LPDLPHDLPDDEPTLPSPAGLEVLTFSVQGDEYAIIGFETGVSDPPGGITASERCILEQLLSGRRPAEIARARARSVNTVKNQIRALYAKLGVKSRVELTALCARGERSA
jgi:DNA-binding CsgD family transcriptional regulator